MSERLKRVLDLFDERHEVLAWIQLVLNTALLLLDKIDGTIWLGAMLLTAVTMLGARRFRGLKGPGGIGVDDE